MKQFFEGKLLEDLYKGLENFKIYISKLNLDDDFNLLFQEIERIWKSEIGFFLLLANETNLNIFDSYYRVRVDTGNINSQLIQEFGVPPVSISKSYKRANVAGFPVFYCSPAIDVAVFETLHDAKFKNAFFYLSKWSTERNLNTLTTHFLFKESLKSELSNDAKNINHHTSKLMEQISSEQRLSKEQQAFIDAYIQFVANEFLNEKNYALSSYVGHSTLYANHNMRSSMLFYPSVKKQHNGLNIAVNPNFAARHLKLDKVYYCKVTDNSDSNIKINIFQVGVPTDNMLVWSDISEDEVETIRREYKIEN